MEHILKYKILSLPAFIWGLQLLYVALALGLLVIVWSKLGGRSSRVPVQIVYVLAMLAINIVWRVAIQKLKPEWF